MITAVRQPMGVQLLLLLALNVIAERLQAHSEPLALGMTGEVAQMASRRA